MLSNENFTSILSISHQNIHIMIHIHVVNAALFKKTTLEFLNCDSLNSSEYRFASCSLLCNYSAYSD